MDASERVLEEVGRVVRSGPGRATVRIPRSRQCEGCHGCSVLDQEEGMLAEVDDPLGAKPGDEVRIVTRGTQGQASAALLLYGLPLAMMLGGAIGGQALFRSWGVSGELPAVGGGLLFLAASFLLLYWLRRRSGSGRSRVVEILGRSQMGELPQ